MGRGRAAGLLPAVPDPALQLDREGPLHPGELASLAAATLGTLTTGIALALALGRWPGVDKRLHASGAQTAYRFNSYIALALAERLGGAQGLAWMALVIAISVPVANVAAVWPLARHGGQSTLRELARNPLVISTLAGLVANGVGLALPDAVATTLQRIGLAALPLGLMAVGAGLAFGALRSAPALAAALLAIRHAVLPVVALALTAALMLPAEQRAIVVLSPRCRPRPPPTCSPRAWAVTAASSPGGDGVDAARNGRHPALARARERGALKIAALGAMRRAGRRRPLQSARIESTLRGSPRPERGQAITLMEEFDDDIADQRQVDDGRRPERHALLWVVRDHLGLTGTKFGCGMALCGACTVHLDGAPARSCQTPLSAAVGKKITTIEASATRLSARHCRTPGWRSACRSAATARLGRS